MMVLFNKPYGVLCQFTDRGGSRPGGPRQTLAEFGLPPDVYPAGRLDFDSEGLLLLTDDGALAHHTTDTRHGQPKTYVVQVEGAPDEDALQRLRDGVELKDGITRPAEARVMQHPPQWLWPRDPPVRFRKTVPDAWLELTLREGRNRQVRRMTAAAGLPTLRLIRTGIGAYSLDGLLRAAGLAHRAGISDRADIQIVLHLRLAGRQGNMSRFSYGKNGASRSLSGRDADIRVLEYQATRRVH